LAVTGLGRVVGWIAHAMEQYHRNALVRPHAAYVGPLP
jgi:citrate synthase